MAELRKETSGFLCKLSFLFESTARLHSPKAPASTSGPTQSVQKVTGFPSFSSNGSQTTENGLVSGMLFVFETPPNTNVLQVYSIYFDTVYSYIHNSISESSLLEISFNTLETWKCLGGHLQDLCYGCHWELGNLGIWWHLGMKQLTEANQHVQSQAPTTLPSGRPKWDAKTTDFAPLSSTCSTAEVCQAA